MATVDTPLSQLTPRVVGVCNDHFFGCRIVSAEEFFQVHIKGNRELRLTRDFANGGLRRRSICGFRRPVHTWIRVVIGMIQNFLSSEGNLGLFVGGLRW